MKGEITRMKSHWKYKTIMAHIPPIEIGNPDDDEYEEKVTDRTILNRHISTTFPDCELSYYINTFITHYCIRLYNVYTYIYTYDTCIYSHGRNY